MISHKMDFISVCPLQKVSKSRLAAKDMLSPGPEHSVCTLRSHLEAASVTLCSEGTSQGHSVHRDRRLPGDWNKLCDFIEKEHVEAEQSMCKTGSSKRKEMKKDWEGLSCPSVSRG